MNLNLLPQYLRVSDQRYCTECIAKFYLLVFVNVPGLGSLLKMEFEKKIPVKEVSGF